MSLNFIKGLPKVGDKSVILTIIDHFSKYAHFINLAHSYTAETVATTFFKEIVRLHDVPASLVSDRDPVFTSAFWKALFAAMGSDLHMSSAFHPQSDGQSEAVNKVIAMYLRCMVGDRPRTWVHWLAWAEYPYNTFYHSALKETLFKVVYGRDLPCLRSYDSSDCHVAAVSKTMGERDEFLVDICLRLEQAQHIMKKHYDKGHRELSFDVGDWFGCACIIDHKRAFLTLEREAETAASLGHTRFVLR